MRYALNGLRRSPGFAIVAILTLALGIGANTAIYSVVYSLLLRPLPYAEPDRLVVISETDPAVGEIAVAYPNFLDWKERARSFSSMAVINTTGFNLAGAGQAERVQGMIVSPNLLQVLGLRPEAGHDLTGNGAEALVSERFAGTLGTAISLDGRVFTVTGIIPRQFVAPTRIDVIASIAPFEKGLTDRGAHGDTQVLARLRPGVPSESAAREMDVIAAALAKQYPATNDKNGAKLMDLRENMVGDTRVAVLILFGAVSLILLIACANVANLLLVRGAARAKEFSVRTALGASRSQLIRQVMTESLVLSLCGMLPGLAVAWWGVRGLAAVIPPDTLPAFEIGLEPGVLAFASLAALLSALICGAAPAWRAARHMPNQTLKPRTGMTRALAVAEAALAVVLAVGAGLMVRSMHRLYQVDPGFRPENTMAVQVSLDPEHYQTTEAINAYWRKGVATLSTIPGVTHAAAGTAIPLAFDHMRADVTLEGETEYPHPDLHLITADYPATMGLRLLAGRVLEERDRTAVVINSLFARKHFGSDAAAVGRRLLMGHPEPGKPWREIVGVVADTRMYGLASPSRLEVYLPYTERKSEGAYFIVRYAGGSQGLANTMRARLAAIDPAQAVYGITTLEKLVADSAPLRQMIMVILGLFSSLALTLAAIGLYGVMAYAAERRTREIGIRVALGAQSVQVMNMMMRSGVGLAVLGALIGLGAAALLAQGLDSVLYATPAVDPVTYASVGGLLVTVALGACWVPARRAMRVDPLIALRHE